MSNHIKVSILDYGMGNVWSVQSALNYIGVKTNFVSSPEELVSAECLVLPGVGSFKKAMDNLKLNSLDEAIKEVSQKGVNILGICLGMQLLGSSSTEDGLTKGLNLISNKVERFDFEDTLNIKVPHIGFNSVNASNQNALYKGLPDKSDFYFVHSYRMLKEELSSGYAECNYGNNFIASFEESNLFGTQFHPEKSQTNGLSLLRNFLKIC